MSKSEDRLIQNLDKIAAKSNYNELLAWFNTDEKRDRMSSYIESGIVNNDKQLVAKIIAEFLQR